MPNTPAQTLATVAFWAALWLLGWAPCFCFSGLTSVFLAVRSRPVVKGASPELTSESTSEPRPKLREGAQNSLSDLRALQASRVSSLELIKRMPLLLFFF